MFKFQRFTRVNARQLKASPTSPTLSLYHFTPLKPNHKKKTEFSALSFYQYPANTAHTASHTGNAANAIALITASRFILSPPINNYNIAGYPVCRAGRERIRPERLHTCRLRNFCQPYTQRKRCRTSERF